VLSFVQHACRTHSRFASSCHVKAPHIFAPYIADELVQLCSLTLPVLRTSGVVLSLFVWWADRFSSRTSRRLPHSCPVSPHCCSNSMPPRTDALVCTPGAPFCVSVRTDTVLQATCTTRYAGTRGPLSAPLFLPTASDSHCIPNMHRPAWPLLCHPNAFLI
jgi:hypothetical protein